MHVAVSKLSPMKQKAAFCMSPASRTDFVNLGSSSMGYACITKCLCTVFISSMDDSVALANRIITLEGSVYDGMVA